MSRRPELRGPCAGLAALLLSWAAPARAHPGPAETPEFGPPECITVVDTQRTQVLPIQYFLGNDDTAPEPDHITLADSKTHQFYAFRGQISANDPDYALYPFAPTAPAPAALPRWIDHDDLARAEQANAPTIAPDFSAAAIGSDTLSERTDMTGLWQLISPMRVPITVAQARAGARWDLRTVQPGVYQLAAYVFSPPYNAWEPRPGVIKVVDGVREPPAVTLDPVDATLFAGQGRKLTGCVSAPAGSVLRAWSRPSDDPAAAWQLWQTQPIADGAQHFELCFLNSRPGRAGIVQLRVSAVSPAGEEITAYALDQLTLLGKGAACTESSKLCCEPLAATEPQVTASAAQAQSTGAASPQPTAAGAAAPASAPVAPPPPAATGSCSSVPGRTARSGPAAACIWLACLVVALRTLSRRGATASMRAAQDTS